MALTDREIKATKPGDKHQFVADAGGLYLRVAPTGNKTFLYRSRRGGAARWVTLGTYPETSLADARRKVANMAMGAVPERMTVADAFAQWLVFMCRTYKRPKQLEARAMVYLPSLNSKQLRSTTRADWMAPMLKAATRAPVMANRAFGDAKQFLNWCVAQGFIEANPLIGVSKKQVGGAEVARDRVASEAELLQVLHAPMVPKTKLLLVLVLATGQRSGEVRGVRASEVTGSVWEIPKERTKNGKAHRVHLSRATGMLFRAAFSAYGAQPFASSCSDLLNQAMRRLPFEPRLTPHDLRRTMATWMAENGVQPHVVERCLNHTLPGVAGVYNRAKYGAETRAAWHLWVRYLLPLRKRAPST